MLNEAPPLPVERLLFTSSAVRIGMFRCSTSNELFHDSGPIQNHIFVFPRTSIRLHHEDRESFISGPNLVTLYNRGTRFRRTAVRSQPDFCDWFAVAPDILLDVLGARDHRVHDRPESPFDRTHVNSSAKLYLRQRRLISALEAGKFDPLEVEEESVAILRELAHPHSRADHIRSRNSREKVERVKELLANVREPAMSIRQLASAVELSVYHLCRTFRQCTGYSIHAWRQETAMRQSLERVARGNDLLDVATEFHYSSHSHFTSRFRRTFGTVPSRFREEVSGMRAAPVSKG